MGTQAQQKFNKKRKESKNIREATRLKRRREARVAKREAAAPKA